LFDFVRRHTRDERARMQFDQWRPYVLMMHARAVATPLVAMHQYDTAVEVVESALDGIQEFLGEYQQEDRVEECTEWNNLQEWRRELVDERVKFQASRGELTIEILRRKLQEAVEREEFEEAARLRDEIRRRGASDEAST
ncbi:MAG: UvrB/UvrC motif-containing protein, partial [Pirellulales bacterium]|nr:UvrB/UvrC motif-containing protein [Pirellulales bacterium]